MEIDSLPLPILTFHKVLIDIDLMKRTGGTRVLFQALADGPIELVPIIATAFLYIVDGPRTRAYVHPGTDLEVSRFFLLAFGV